MKFKAKAIYAIAASLAGVALVFAGFSMFAEPAEAATNFNFNVSATVDLRCSAVTGGVHFGTYDPQSATPLDAVGNIQVSCTTTWLGALVYLDQGSYPAAGSTNNNPIRQMASGTNRLGYQLYKNAARTQVWNNNIFQSVYTGSTPATLTVYGRMPAGQVAATGNYQDIVVATMFF